MKTIHTSTSHAACGATPVVTSAQPAPVVASQENTRCRLIPIRTISSSARPTAFSKIRRNGGVPIWAMAFTSASNIVIPSAGRQS